MDYENEFGDSIAAIQKRPGMYIGPVEADGRAWLGTLGPALKVLVDFIPTKKKTGWWYLDVERRGESFYFRFSWQENRDRGRNIELYRKSRTLSIPSLQTAITSLHAPREPMDELCLTEVADIICLNALSEKFTIDISVDGNRYYLDYTNGKPIKIEQTSNPDAEEYAEMTIQPAPLFDNKMPNEDTMLGYLMRFEDEYALFKLRVNSQLFNPSSNL